MAKLTEPQKLFVVGRLACFYTPTEVQQALKQEHGVEISLPAVSFYDPNTAEGKRLSRELRELFEKTRADFVANVSAIPIANQAYRVRELNDLYRRAKAKQNDVLAAAHLEHAAKEVGGVFTNRVVVLQQLARDVQKMSNDDLFALLGGNGTTPATGPHGVDPAGSNGTRGKH